MKPIKKNALLFAVALALTTGVTQMAQAQDTTGRSAQTGPSSLQETYQDWVVRCATATAEDGSTPRNVCEMTQELRQKNTGQRVLALSVRADRETDGAGDLTVVAPFGLDLSKGVTISLAEADFLSMGFRTCLPAGCIASAKLDETQMNTLTAGDKATVSMTDTGGQTVQLDVSLAGFTAGLRRLREF